MRVRRFLSMVGGTLFWAGISWSAPSLTDGLRFCLPFDGNAAPKFCRDMAGVSLGAGFLGQGRVGQGVNLAGDASVSAPEPGNFDRPRGTVAFARTKVTTWLPC